MPAETNDPFKGLWDFFCSLKLTIATLLLLATTSVAGTLLPQNLSMEQYRQLFGEPVIRLLRALQLFDMYHSWWFLGLLGVFALNLTACSLRRLPGVWRTVTRPVLLADESLLRSLPCRTTLQLPLPPAEARRRLENVVRRRFARPQTSGEGETLGLFAQKWPWARFSVYMTHLSILLILLGAVIGSLWGFKSFVNIVEGDTIESLPAAGNAGEMPLGFSLRCDDFSISYYQDSNRVREYRSVLTVLENGKEIPGFSQVPVVVNRPLHYRGLNFYQSSFGQTALFRILVAFTQNDRELTVEGYPGQPLPLPGGGSIQILDYTPAYRDQGPAVLLSVQTAAGERFGAIAPTTGPGQVMVDQAPYRFNLQKSEERYYTGLQVSRDPGVPVVWLGCLLLVLGTLSAFLLSHQRLWLVIRPAGEGSEVQLGATAHRNRAALGQLFAQLSNAIAREFDPEAAQTLSEEDR
jgi:cytochrome c biogenesis protein